MRGNPTFTTANPSYCRIYKNNNTYDFWYKLYDYDDKPNTTEITKIRSVKKSNLGKPGVVNDGKDYTPHCQYFPGEYLHILFRETGLSSSSRPRPRSSRTRSISPPGGKGGGKTRRKCKVKKRQNRRRRNTMKRRKTTAKRRNRRK